MKGIDLLETSYYIEQGHLMVLSTTFYLSADHNSPGVRFVMC